MSFSWWVDRKINNFLRAGSSDTTFCWKRAVEIRFYGLAVDQFLINNSALVLFTSVNFSSQTGINCRTRKKSSFTGK